MAGQGGARSGAGAKKKPTHLKVLNGTFRKDRENPEQPELSEALPSPPSHLNDRAVYYFNLVVKRISEMGYASESHTEALALLAMRLEESERLYTTLASDGYTYNSVDSGGRDVVKQRPEVPLYKEAMRHAHTLLVEFGLTPSSMGRVNKKSSPNRPSDPWADL